MDQKEQCHVEKNITNHDKFQRQESMVHTFETEKRNMDNMALTTRGAPNLPVGAPVSVRDPQDKFNLKKPTKRKPVKSKINVIENSKIEKQMEDIPPEEKEKEFKMEPTHEVKRN